MIPPFPLSEIPTVCLVDILHKVKMRINLWSVPTQANATAGRRLEAGGLSRRNAPSLTVTEEGQIMWECAAALPNLRTSSQEALEP